VGQKEHGQLCQPASESIVCTVRKRLTDFVAGLQSEYVGAGSSLLLSDRVLGMTLVPEGRVWNYGIGLTQLWSPNLAYSMTIDTPLLFWAEEHRPSAFLTVSMISH